jgi:hypothetical protein
MENEVIYDVECCVIQMAKLPPKKKKPTPTFFFWPLGVKWKPPPPPPPPPLSLFEFEIFTTLFKILPQNWTTLSHDALLLYPVVSGGACSASRHKHEVNVIQLFPGMLGACRQT